MLHGSETWSVRKENEMARQRAEMRMVRWKSFAYLTSLLQQLKICFMILLPLSCDKQHLSYEVCLDIKSEDYQNCLVLCCFV